MPYDRFIIAPFETGLQTDVRPWLLPDDAFAMLQNMYVFRGRVRKRFGAIYTGNGAQNEDTSQLFSRLSIPLGMTDGAGHITGTVPGSVFLPGQAFSVGTEIFTVYQLSTVAPPTNNMLTTGASTVYNYNTTTGVYTITGAAATTELYFYPSTPVMGLTTYETGPINLHPAYAFDTQFAYTYTGSFWTRSGSIVWHGTNSDFFWVANWRGISNNITNMFVTNFNATVPTPAMTDDPIYTFDGTTWSNFSTSTVYNSAGSYIQTALMIVPFKDRLLMLYPIETNSGNTVNTAYKNRVRFCHNGSPFATNAWLEPKQSYMGTNADGGGWLDAATEEAITSCEFIKDRLIVYFERSTWELAYTGNQVLPFVWQKINTELGSEATFSSVPFDKVILTMGTTGVHACNGSNVERIDNKIPDEIFDIANINEGVTRVAGIRDYYTEMVYWTFPSSNENPSTVFPNQVLVYNYKTGSWALNDDVITAWGYFDQQQTDTWESSTGTWESSLYSWNSSRIEAQTRQIIAGNHQGYIFIISPDYALNAGVMQISNMVVSGSYVNLTVVNHTLTVGDFITINDAQGVTFTGSPIVVIAKIIAILSANVVQVGPLGFTGTYTGGGTVTRLSNINLLSKQWNPYVDQARNVYVAKIDFGLLNSERGEPTSTSAVTVDYFTSSSNLSNVLEGTDTGALLGTSVLETGPYRFVPLETYQQTLWHPIYFQGDGEFIQIQIYWSDAQMFAGLAVYDFELQSMVLHTTPTSQRLQ